MQALEVFVKQYFAKRFGLPSMRMLCGLARVTEGFDALAAARKGKKTLRTTEVEWKPVVEVSPDDLRAIRERLNLSRLNRPGF